LRQILTQAVDDDRILKNPCRIRRGGVEHHPEQRFATVPELLALSRNVPHRYKAMILTAGLGGLRQGELLALRRADLDLDDALVYVRRKRQVLDSGAVLENAPKTRAGRRVVSLPQPLVEELRTHLELYVGVESTAYVFTSSEGVPIERNNFRQRIWMPGVEASSMDGFHFHELRHTAGTLAEMSDVAVFASFHTVRDEVPPGDMDSSGDVAVGSSRDEDLVGASIDPP